MALGKQVASQKVTCRVKTEKLILILLCLVPRISEKL